MQKLLLVYRYYSANCTTSQIWKALPNMFFPWFGGGGEGLGNGGVLSMRMQVTLDSLFAHPGSAPIGARKESSGTGPQRNLKLAYEVKKIIVAYLKDFSKKRRTVFLFGIYIFFTWEIFTFLYYANEGSDDDIGGSTKTVQHSIKNISRNI